MLHLKIKSFFTVFFYTLFLLNLLGFFPGTDADTPFVICIEYYCELLWTVGNEAFFRWVPPVVEPAICPVILQSWPRIVACVSMDVTRTLHPWRVSMVFTRIHHPFALLFALKGESLNPSAHDQTCFSCLFQKRILISIFVTPWALMTSVTFAFHCFESYAPFD